jgi:flagellar biogenesis protein FliO
MDDAIVLRFVVACTGIALGLAALTAFGTRGRLRAVSFLRRERLVEVIETTPLPHASSLHVVKVADAYLVIGRCDGGISLLGEIPRAAAERAAARAESR